MKQTSSFFVSSRVFRYELFEVLPGRGDVNLDERSGNLRLRKAAATTYTTAIIADDAIIYVTVSTLTLAALLAGGGHHHHDVCVAGEEVDERRELRVPHLHALHTYIQMTCRI